MRRASTWSLAVSLAACAGAPTGPQYNFRSGLLNPTDEALQVADDVEVVPPAHSAPARPKPTSAPTRVVQAAALPPPVASPKPPMPSTSQPGASTPVRSPPLPAAHVQTAAAPPLDVQSQLRATHRVEAAAALLGTPGMTDSAFVAHVLRAAGQHIEVDRALPYPQALFDKIGAVGSRAETAQPGDLVFFRDTADLNGNGKPDDGVTLVGVVERVERTRAVFIAQRANKVRRMAVDPSRAEVVRDERDEVINTRLVRWPGSLQPLTTGQCLVGYWRP